MTIKLRKLCCAPLLALSAIGCGSDDDDKAATLPATAGDAVAQYADIVYATYADALTVGEALDTAVDAFVAAPSAALLDDARDAWRTSRPSYLQSEVFRFYDGPIDNPEDGPEGLINAWPLDENYIDYVVGEPESGMVNDPQLTIDGETLEGQNEAGGEANIATGYHAIEFLLWGQDTSDTGPGDRPYTDYVTGAGGTMENQDRRAEYLTTASTLLVGHLEQLEAAWAPGSTTNYRADFVAQPAADALGKIFSGMIILSGFETGGERLQAALDSHGQEEEHSCFSDNTHVDMIEDVRGMQNVWLGSYEKLDGTTVSGPSLQSIIAAGDSGLAGQITDQIATSLEAAEALQPPFDQEIKEGNTAGNARVEALIESLFAQRQLLEQAFQLYDLQRIPDPTP